VPGGFIACQQPEDDLAQLSQVEGLRMVAQELTQRGEAPPVEAGHEIDDEAWVLCISGCCRACRRAPAAAAAGPVSAVPSDAAADRRAETEAEAEVRQAEAERRRARALEARLRALGVTPEED
jgi:hypothetical protein